MTEAEPEKESDTIKKWKAITGMYGMPNVFSQNAHLSSVQFTTEWKKEGNVNPFSAQETPSANIAWEVSKTGGVVDPNVAKKAVEQGFNPKLFVPEQPGISQPLQTSNSDNTGYFPNWQQQPQTNNPWITQQQQVFPYTGGIYNPPTPQVEKKPEYKPEDFHGRFCAYVLATVGDKQYTGVLFVKRCGSWKLLEYNGHKVAGGGVGTFEDMLRSGDLKLTVILTIYDADRIEKTDDTDLEIT